MTEQAANLSSGPGRIIELKYKSSYRSALLKITRRQTGINAPHRGGEVFPHSCRNSGRSRRHGIRCPARSCPYRGVHPPKRVSPWSDSSDEISDAKSAYRISRFGRCAGAGEPIGWRFCLRPLESVAKRALFSCRAALAKVRTRSKKQNFKLLFIVVLEVVNRPFLRFTTGEKNWR